MAHGKAFFRHVRIFSVLAVLSVLFAVKPASSTPYWTPQQIAEEFQRTHATQDPSLRPTAPHGRRHALDDIAYFQHYRMLCDFLVGLQFTDAGSNHGGMIEGESGSDHSIIETDNTQEAIRVWSQYAIWTGDTATYGPHIRMAQGYLSLWPAWREGAGYYSGHNCGWGFEAVAKYRQAYNDTTWNWYADSCAWWTMINTLVINETSHDLSQLDPLAAGLAIGGMYPHAVYRQRTDWTNHALNTARSIKRWFENYPQRLSGNESWALCGGTALWGLCESLFAAYPDSGEAWINQYGSQLRVWSSSGTWNHSYNAWYCNAQNKCFELTGDSTYWNNAVFITDSLIGLDTDNDGGITPGRSYPVTNDASWVSSYMGWMGMERIINRMPHFDVAARAFISPNPVLPHLAGDSLLISASVVNNGIEAQTLWVRVSGLAYSDSVSIRLEGGRDSVITMPHRWVMADDSTLPPSCPLVLHVTAPADDNAANDTLSTAFDIRRGVNVFGAITGVSPQDHFPVRIEFYNGSYPDSVWTAVEQSNDSLYTNGPRHLMAGINTIRVIPPLRYMDARQNVTLTPGAIPQQVDFTLGGTDVALIDNSPGDTLERFYETSLEPFSLHVRTWDLAALGMVDLTSIPTVIWFTGNAVSPTLGSLGRNGMMEYLNGGGRLILSGQNISDDTSNTAFLRDVLHCSPRNNATNLRRVFGEEDDTTFSGVDLYLLGQGGAQNQTSPSSIFVLPGSEGILHFAAGTQDTCGVKGAYGDGRYIFLSVGLEAASGISQSTTRTDFLTRCFAWLNSASYSAPRAELPVSLTLSQNFPNPFNPTTTISFLAPRGAKPVRLTIYNLLGQEVRTLYDGLGMGTSQTVTWDGLSAAGVPVSSGMYVYRLRAGSSTLVRPLQLVR
ncbi:MAG TPA: T9SS type A sorting domain-containing protein [bacterium]|jgi:hypothetical protein